jgi:tetratricopeptide (TPR) repeat protein
MPATEAIGRWEAELQSARNRPLFEAHALHSLGLQRAESGDVQEGRRLNKQAREIWEELGYQFFSAGTQLAAGIIELLADDPAAAEVALRRGYEELEAMGERAVLSTLSAWLAEAIYAQGRYEEAEPFTRVSEAAAATEDLESQVRWRAARAKLLARRGDIERGERLAREAVALAKPTDSPNLKADALMDLVEVLCLSRRTAEARPHLSRALALYQGKGNVVSARRAEALLAGLPLPPEREMPPA